MVTVFFGILGLGIMVLIHELGHFLAAKANGVEVEVFSLGWGRRVVGFQHRGTTYQISWFPLGGYCKMKGDDALREAWRNDNAEYPLEPGSFFAASPWRRIAIIAAGPLANLAFAVVVLSLIWWAGFRIDSPENRIVLASDFSLDAISEPTPAQASGLRSGDRITRIAGHDIGNFQDIRRHISSAPRRELPITVERDGMLLATAITPELDPNTGGGRIWVYPWIEPVLEVRLGGAASLAGLRSGDRVVAVNAVAVRHSIDVVQHLQAGAAQVDFTIERDGQTLPVTVALTDGADELGLGFRLPQSRSPRLSPVGALARGMDDTWNTMALTFSGFARLFEGNARNAVAGPLRITYFVGRAATDGFERSFGEGLVRFFRLLCLISIVLFIMNLLPLPALDGGHLALCVTELIRGKPLRPAVVYRIQTLGMSLLLVLAITVTFSDILFFAGK